MIARFQEVFKLLRTLAFIGAGFILAKYGWDAITSGKIAGKESVTDVFFSAYILYILYQFLPPCANYIYAWV